MICIFKKQLEFLKGFQKKIGIFQTFFAQFCNKIRILKLWNCNFGGANMFDFFFPVRQKILQNMAGNGGKRVTFRSKFWDFFFWEISDKILGNRRTPIHNLGWRKRLRERLKWINYMSIMIKGCALKHLWREWHLLSSLVKRLPYPCSFLRLCKVQSFVCEYVCFSLGD